MRPIDFHMFHSITLADPGGGGQRSTPPPPQQLGIYPIICIVFMRLKIVVPPPPPHMDLFFGLLVTTEVVHVGRTVPLPHNVNVKKKINELIKKKLFESPPPPHSVTFFWAGAAL